MFDGSHTVPRNQWAGSVLTEVRVPELSVCDFADARVRAAITVDTSALTSNDFSLTHAWGWRFKDIPTAFKPSNMSAGSSGARVSPCLTATT